MKVIHYSKINTTNNSINSLVKYNGNISNKFKDSINHNLKWQNIDHIEWNNDNILGNE